MSETQSPSGDSALRAEEKAPSSYLDKERAVGKQIFHMIFLAILMLPSLLFNSAINALTPELRDIFGTENINNLSYTLTAIPSIFTLVFASVFLDSFGTVVLFPIFWFFNLFACMLCILGLHCASQPLFLAGRFFFGFGGELTYTAQAKVISKLFRPNFLAIAFAIAFIGMTSGEMLAIIILPRFDTPLEAYCLILGLQSAAMIGVIYYSVIMKRIQREMPPRLGQKEKTDATRDSVVTLATESLPDEPHEVKERVERKQSTLRFGAKMKEVLKQLKEQNLSFWFLAVSRILFTSMAKVYDSRALISMTERFNIPKQTTQNNITYQFIAIIAMLFLQGVFGKWITKIQYLPLIGLALGVIAMLLFAVTNTGGFALALSILEGLAVGANISSTTTLQVKIASEGLGACAVGMIFSLRYLMITIMTPVVQKVATYGQEYNGFIYFGLYAIALICLFVAVATGVGW